MTFLTVIFGAVFLFGIYDITISQHSEFPKRFFEPIKFDYTIRGAYNVSGCLQELLTCWELLRPDIACSFDKHIESMCSTMRNLCHDRHGELQVMWYQFDFYERYCTSREDNDES